jgi:hypothetical protein
MGHVNTALWIAMTALAGGGAVAGVLNSFVLMYRILDDRDRRRTRPELPTRARSTYRED